MNVYTNPAASSTPRKDPILRDHRVRVRFTVRAPIRETIGKPTHVQAKYILPTTHPDTKNAYPPGTHEALVYQSELPHILGAVEDRPDALAMARATYFRGLRERVLEEGRHEGGIRIQEHEIASEDISQWPVAARLIEQTHGESIEKVFGELVIGRRTGVKPLEKVEIVEDGIAPLDDDQTQQLKGIVKELAQNLGTLGGGASADVVAMLIEQNRQLMARLEALEADATAPKKR